MGIFMPIVRRTDYVPLHMVVCPVKGDTYTNV